MKVIDYWLRLEKLDNSGLLKKSFNLVKSMHNAGFKTWMEKVQNILEEINCSHYLNGDLIENYDVIHTSVKELIYGLFQRKWFDLLSCFPKMRTFLRFKTVFQLEPYLLSIKDFKMRRIMSRFRLSSHDLEIERGRYLKPATPADKRFCKLCSTTVNEVEDEEHVLMRCYVFDHLRTDFFKLVKSRNPDTSLNFLTIMGTKDPAIIFYVAKFLQKVFKERQCILNSKS